MMVNEVVEYCETDYETNGKYVIYHLTYHLIYHLIIYHHQPSHNQPSHNLIYHLISSFTIISQSLISQSTIIHHHLTDCPCLPKKGPTCVSGIPNYKKEEG